MSNQDVTSMLVLAVFASTLGMFQFGFNTGVINAPQKVLEEFIAQIYKTRSNTVISEDLKSAIWSLTVGIFAIGGMIGGYFGPMVADKFGRKISLIYNNIFAVIGVGLMSFSQIAQSFECLIVGRFFIGLNCGANTALVPLYLTEIATINLRGAIGIVSQVAVTIGLLASQVLGHQDLLGTKERWPFLFGIAFLPAILQLTILPLCPGSPRYLLLNRNKEAEARLSLRRLRNNSNVEEDILEMKAEAESQEEEIRLYGKVSSVCELLRHSWLREPLYIAIVMQLSQQLSGINAVFNYSTDIFLTAEIPANYAVYATMGVGVVMVVMSLVSIPLIDRLGRRTLQLVGLGGMFWMSIILTISLLVKDSYDWIKYVSVLSVLLYTLFFAVGPGSLPWMITGELFTQGARPAAVSVAVLVNWSNNFLVGISFLFFKSLLLDYLFVPYTIAMAVFWVYLYNKLPETKNRTFGEISALFKRPKTVYGVESDSPTSTNEHQRLANQSKENSPPSSQSSDNKSNRFFPESPRQSKQDSVAVTTI